MLDNTTTKGCGCCSTSSKPTPTPTVLTRILDKVFVTDVEKNRRMDICRACEHFQPTLAQCGICGCFLEAKTRLVNYHCAADEPKW